MFDILMQACSSGVHSWFGGGLAPRVAGWPRSPCRRARRRGFAAAPTRVPRGSGAASGLLAARALGGARGLRVQALPPLRARGSVTTGVCRAHVA